MGNPGPLGAKGFQVSCMKSLMMIFMVISSTILVKLLSVCFMCNRESVEV